MLFKMAFRNILRQKRRTLLTVLMMFFGYVLLSFVIAFETGTYDQIISMFTEHYVGHVQIHSPKYVETPTLYNTLENKNELIKELDKDPLIRAYSLRLKSGALASYETKTFGAEVYGVDLEDEENTTGISSRIVRGHMPAKSSFNEVAIGGKLARILGLDIGQELVLISQAADGSIANDLFKVVGLFDGSEQSKDDFRVYMSLNSAQEFYALYGAAHEVAINLKSISTISKFQKNFTDKTTNTIRSWKVIEKEFYKAMEADKAGSDVSFFIIMFIVGMGVLNTILMSTLERTREFGVLKAIGTTPFNIMSLITLETLFVSLTAITIGAVISTFINLYFQSNGISLGESFSYGGVTFSVMYAHLSAKSYYIPAFIVLVTALLVSFYPGFKASRISPVDAMREF